MGKHSGPPPIKGSRLELRIYATLRSGHNGIMRWLMGHFDGNILHRYPGTGPENRFIYWDMVRDPDDPKRNLYMMNVENANLENVRKMLNSNAWLTQQGKADRIAELLILRDPYNCFASVRKLMGQSFVDASMVKYWKQHAKEIMDPYYVRRAVPCLFNKWFTDKAYRDGVAEKLGLKPTDKNFGQIGQHSAFEKDQKDPLKMDLFGRWKEFKDDPEFQASFDDEIHGLAEMLFGKWAAEVQSQLT